ncbi:MAG: hypothetical protein B7Z60_08740 [Ferrovum sp. 37-45-19]|nr:MAG: hypothetical protein B7Z60_08740 [Ferrovum sp. 37-45-19]
MPYEVSLARRNNLAVVTVEDGGLETATLHLRWGIGGNAELLAHGLGHEKAIPVSHGNKCIAFLLRQFVECGQRVAKIERAVIVLHIADIGRNGRIEFHHTQYGCVAFERIPDVIVVSIDIDGQDGDQ